MVIFYDYSCSFQSVILQVYKNEPDSALTAIQAGADIDALDVESQWYDAA